MSRYGNVATLNSYTVEYNDDGTPVETPYQHDVFIDDHTIGLTAWAAARSEGLHADMSVKMRACDYAGEQTLMINGDEYEIERVQGKGEFVILTLKKRLRDATSHLRYS